MRVLKPSERHILIKGDKCLLPVTWGSPVTGAWAVAATAGSRLWLSSTGSWGAGQGVWGPAPC